ncbi:hypothetical protein I4U23_017035 [Adineta vaga]|nr:hypothetical protein I4U23_017035 [Adineta vaga]
MHIVFTASRPKEPIETISKTNNEIPFFEAVRAQQQATPTTGPYSQNNRTERKSSVWQTKDRSQDMIDMSLDKVQTAINIEEPIHQHLESLKFCFNQTLVKHLSTNDGVQERLIIYNKLYNIILARQPDSKITLYGAFLFKCGLGKLSKIDIDVQFEEPSEYDPMYTLLDIIRDSGLCGESRFDTDHDVPYIDLLICDSNINVRLTSGYNDAINLSKLIQIYTKFDQRVLQLLRLIRVLAKVSNLDRPDLGTLHPVVFHVMVIHFLQQLENPVLPCLHEYAFGVEHVPIKLRDHQYDDFFRLCNQYTRKWKSKNTTNIEMLFLQFLSYYVEKFDAKKFIISIQTRMPILKIGNRQRKTKLICEDPIFITKNLCSTMQATCSHIYFRQVLKNSLEYFCSTHEKNSTNENKNESLDNRTINAVHNSYQLFVQDILSSVRFDVKMTQKDIRQLYFHTFDKKNIPLPEPILKSNKANRQLCLDKNDNENEIQDVFQPYFQENMKIFDSNYDDNVITPIQISSDSNKELNNNESSLMSNNEKSSNIQEIQNFHVNESDTEPVMRSFETLCQNINKKQRRILHREFERQGEVVNDKVLQLFNSFNLQTIVLPDLSSAIDKSHTESEHLLSSQDETIPSNLLETSSHHNSTVLFYDFQAENFGAEQGAPVVCVSCYESGHIKSNCPKESTPNVVEINQEWEDILSKLCRYITERYRLTRNDIENRKQLVRHLQTQYQKIYPECKLQAYGSFCNGFGFQQSDLDICIYIKENIHEDNVRILEKLSRSMCCNTFEYVRVIDYIKVPIIRSKHSQLNIEFDISIHNKLAIENTNLLKTYANIDSRVVELGYMIKYLVKFIDVKDCRKLSSYAYIIMVIHFLQQIQPPVLPVLQQVFSCVFLFCFHRHKHVCSS